MANTTEMITQQQLAVQQEYGEKVRHHWRAAGRTPGLILIPMVVSRMRRTVSGCWGCSGRWATCRQRRPRGPNVVIINTALSGNMLSSGCLAMWAP